MTVLYLCMLNFLFWDHFRCTCSCKKWHWAFCVPFTQFPTTAPSCKNYRTTSHPGSRYGGSQDTGQPHQHQDPHVALASFPALQPPSPLASTNLLSISILLSFHECYINAIRQYITFCGWTFFSQHNSLELHPSCCRWFLFIAEQCSVLWMHRFLFNHPAAEGHLVSCY